MEPLSKSEPEEYFVSKEGLDMQTVRAAVIKIITSSEDNTIPILLDFREEGKIECGGSVEELQAVMDFLLKNTFKSGKKVKSVITQAETGFRVSNTGIVTREEFDSVYINFGDTTIRVAFKLNTLYSSNQWCDRSYSSELVFAIRT